MWSSVGVDVFDFGSWRQCGFGFIYVQRCWCWCRCPCICVCVSGCRSGLWMWIRLWMWTLVWLLVKQQRMNSCHNIARCKPLVHITWKIWLVFCIYRRVVNVNDFNIMQLFLLYHINEESLPCINHICLFTICRTCVFFISICQKMSIQIEPSNAPPYLIVLYQLYLPLNIQWMLLWETQSFQMSIALYKLTQGCNNLVICMTSINGTCLVSCPSLYSHVHFMCWGIILFQMLL